MYITGILNEIYRLVLDIIVCCGNVLFPIGLDIGFCILVYSGEFCFLGRCIVIIRVNIIFVLNKIRRFILDKIVSCGVTLIPVGLNVDFCILVHSGEFCFLSSRKVIVGVDIICVLNEVFRLVLDEIVSIRVVLFPVGLNVCFCVFYDSLKFRFLGSRKVIIRMDIAGILNEI